jgi:hypothetical protein
MNSWLGRFGVWFVAWAALALPAIVSAQSQGAVRVAVLRATQGDAGTAAEAIDGALLRDLAGIAGIENPTVSPIDYAEIQLTVGCSDEGRECLAQVAQMVQVDAVVVRKLAVEAGRSTLTLVYLDATAPDAPATAEQVAEGDQAAQQLTHAVPSLVRKLFGIPEPVTAAAAPSSSEPATSAPAGAARSDVQVSSDGGGVSPLTWVALGVGAGVLGAGIVVGVGAQNTFDDFKAIDVHDEDDAKRANDKFDSAESKGKVATILFPAGAAVLALGATLLVLDLSDDGGSEETQVGVTPLPGGALLALHARTGSW